MAPLALRLATITKILAGRPLARVARRVRRVGVVTGETAFGADLLHHAGSVRPCRDRAGARACERVMSAMQGAMAFQKGLGAVHSLSQALGALRVGPQNAVLLPEVVKFSQAAVPDKVEAIADVFGVRGGTALARASRDLAGRLGLPSGLGAMGINPDVYDAIASDALKDHCHGTHPRAASDADYVAMLAASA